MNTNAVEKFEHEVRTVVRRGSKSSEFESPIKEMANHYEDLIQEELSNGATNEEAEVLAKKRIGSPLSVGLQILNCPQRRIRGIWTQKIAYLILLLVLVQYLGLAYCSINRITGNYMTFWYFVVVIEYLWSGVLFGRGILQANRILWVPAVLFLPLITLSLGVAYEVFRPMLERNHAVFIMSRSGVLVAGVEVALWMVGVFLAIGFVYVLIGQIRIQRRIGFQVMEQ